MTSERKVGVITGASRGINTIPGMPCINRDQYDIDGIRVERFTTAPKDAAQRPLATRFTPSTDVVAAVRQRSALTRS